MDKEYEPWVPITDPLTLKTLGKLSEELGELQAALSRCIIQGVDGREPVTGKSNRLWLQEEMADVQANMGLVFTHLGLNMDFIVERAEKKQKKLRIWHGMPT